MLNGWAGSRLASFNLINDPTSSCFLFFFHNFFLKKLIISNVSSVKAYDYIKIIYSLLES